MTKEELEKENAELKEANRVLLEAKDIDDKIDWKALADKAEVTKELTEAKELIQEEVQEVAKVTFKDGAEFGYNKANEWHYPSKGELPKEPKRYLCKIECNVGGAITYECSDYDVEYNSWKDSYGDVIAWKEIED